MAEDNPKISVDYLKQNYPIISYLLEDEDLEEIVGLLGHEKIKTKRALEFVSRETLLAKQVSGLFVDIVKPPRAKAPPAPQPSVRNALVPQILDLPLPVLPDIEAGTTTDIPTETITIPETRRKEESDKEPLADNTGARAPAESSGEGNGSKIDETKKELRTKRQLEENAWEGNKRRKYWQPSKVPISVASPTKFWYQGYKDSELFIRQCTLECFGIMWKEVKRAEEEWGSSGRKRCVAFIITGAPGIGKSWSSNTIVWYLLKKRQNVWFHSASEHKLITVEFVEGKEKPTVAERPEADVHHAHPSEGTWFLYDSVGGSGPASALIPFKEQPPGILCVIFSSPKDTNYKQGVRQMEGGPGGGLVMKLWTPPWEWEELQAVMPFMYKEAGGTKTEGEFKDFILALYRLWGGIPRRFNKYCESFRSDGKEAAIEKSRKEFDKELRALSRSLVENGPAICHELLDEVGQSGESEKLSRKTAPPSWLVFPVPIDSCDGPFRYQSYKFCSQQAELAFLGYLEKQDTDAVRKFCKDVFAFSGVCGIAFERFAHFVLTRTELNKFQWAPYNDNTSLSAVELPRCAGTKCDMKNDLRAFQNLIADIINKGKNVVIDPQSDEQDAIDMFAVIKLKDEWCVLAMQDTISKTHSFHPVKILEYRACARAAFVNARIENVSKDFFRHVVVVPNQDPKSTFRLKKATMTKLTSVESVLAKFEEIHLEVPPPLNDKTTWNRTEAYQVCQIVNLRNRSSLKGPELLTAGAGVLLLREAEEKVKNLTWVLDGFL